MITPRLKLIFGLSILFFIAHGIEEYLMGFYNLDQWDEWIFGLLPFVSIHQAMFATFQVMFWLGLIAVFISLISGRARLYLLAFVGIIYIFELHHPLKALLAGGYYPGLITSLAFPILTFLFWREWLRIFQASSLKK